MLNAADIYIRMHGCKLKLCHLFSCGLFFINFYCLEKTSTQHSMLLGLPFRNVGFSTKQHGDFSSNIEYGGGGGGGRMHKSIVFPK